MTGNGKQFNPFRRMDEQPVQPPFLVRDTRPESVVQRHQQRMARHSVAIRMPQQSNVALRGKAALGLSFDQQEALVDALTGVYAEKHWRDLWGNLYKRWGLGDILDTMLLYDGQTNPDRVRRVLAPLLFSLSPDLDEEARALLFLFQAWQIRQQVVVDRRAMSLIPVVGGAEMGSAVSFTPVLKRIDMNLWRLGWPGDKRDESPQLIPGSLPDALKRAFPLFNDWYFEDQKEGRIDRRGGVKPEHIHLIPWSDRLRQKRSLDVGPARLEEVSHNAMFRLRLPDGRRFILRSDPVTAVQAGMMASKSKPETPALEEINNAYLKAMERRGESAQCGEKPDAADVRPFDFFEVDTAYVLSIEGKSTRREITVTWVSGHKQAIALVCGSNHPARAVVMSNNRSRLGVAPVGYRTKKPDLDQLWAFTPADDLDWRLESDRLAITHWAAWVWHEKAGSHLPPPRGHK